MMISFNKKWLMTCLKLLFITCITLVTTSCWSSQNIEEQAYITAMGIDFKDDLYYVYGHEMNFKEIDEPSMRQDNISRGIFVGTGIGKTLYEAAYSLERATQGKIDWGHVEAIVVTEDAMKKDSIGLLRKMYRFPDTRINCWIYVSGAPIIDILSTSNMYDDASMRTVLYEPQQSYHRLSHIKPVLAFKLIANYFEPDRTIIIPVITLNEDQWKSNHEGINLLEISGAYVVSRYGNMERLEREEAHLLRVTFVPSRFSISLQKEDTTYGVVSLKTKKKEVKANIIGSNVKFDMNISYSGGLVEYTEFISQKELIDLTKKKIEDEIRQAYAIGLEKQIDVLNLMPSLRHKNHAAWKQLTDGGKTFILTEDSLQNVNINVRIPFTGKYKSIPDNIHENNASTD